MQCSTRPVPVVGVKCVHLCRVVRTEAPIQGYGQKESLVSCLCEAGRDWEEHNIE